MLEQEPQLTAGFLFSGMGGFASGLANAGFAVRWASDNDEYGCLAFRYNLTRDDLAASHLENAIALRFS